MSQPTPYNRQASFTTIQQEAPTDPLPGSDLDAELNAVKQTLDETLQNIALIQRDDGEIANKSVGLDQLKSEVEIGFNAPEPWATATKYEAFNAVFINAKFYRCLVEHTSTVFNTDLLAGKWEEIADFTQLGAYWTGNSTTSLTIGTGPQSFTIESDRFFAVGDYVVASADDANYMIGRVTSYAGTSLAVNVEDTGGAGTFASWTVRLSGFRGPQGEQGLKGDTATVTIGVVTTLAPGEAATVANVGTSSDAILNFGIPQGDPGADASGDVVGPAGATDGHVAAFDGATGKLIKDGALAVTDLVTGPAAAVDGNLVAFNGATGKIAKDSGLSLDTDVTLAADSDAKIPSQKAVKAYVDNLAPADVFTPATHDDTGIQGAVDAAAAAGGGIVQLEDADYTFSAHVQITSDNIWIRGSAKTRLLATAGAVSIDGLIRVSGSLGTATTISADAAVADTTVTLASVANVAVGDYIEIFVTQAVTGYNWTLITRILSLVGNVVTLADPMPFAVVAASDTSSVKQATLRKNIRLENLRFFGNGNTGNPTRAIFAQHMLRSHFDGIYLESFHQGGIYWDQGYANSFGTIKAYDCGNGAEDDVLIRAQTRMAGGRIISESASGFGPQFFMTAWSSFESAISTHSNSRAIKLQGSVFCTFGTLQGNNCGDTGIAISLGSSYNSISNAIVVSNNGGLGGQKVGIWFSGQANTNNRIGSVIAKNNQVHDIQFFATDEFNTIGNAIYDALQDQGTGNSVNGNSVLRAEIAATIDFSAAGDTTINIPIPRGATRWRLGTMYLSGASASLTAATFGLFTGAGGTGTALIAAGTAITVSSAAENTNNNMQSFTSTNVNSQSHNQTSIFFRVGATAAATATFTFGIEFLS